VCATRAAVDRGARRGLAARRRGRPLESTTAAKRRRTFALLLLVGLAAPLLNHLWRSESLAAGRLPQGTISAGLRALTRSGHSFLGCCRASRKGWLAQPGWRASSSTAARGPGLRGSLQHTRHAACAGHGMRGVNTQRYVSSTRLTGVSRVGLLVLPAPSAARSPEALAAQT